MKKWHVCSIIIILLLLPAKPHAEDAEATTVSAKDLKEEIIDVKAISDLPDVVKAARDVGAEEDEIQELVKGVKDDKLTAQEGISTVKTIEENAKAGKSNNGISEFVFQQKEQGLKGKELGKAIKAELQRRHAAKKMEKIEKKTNAQDKGKKKAKSTQGEDETQTEKTDKTTK